MDDTVNYIFEGKGSDNGSFRLFGSKGNTNAGTKSKYKNEDTKNMCGLRVKITYTFLSAGTMDPIFISVLGLTERELQKGPIVTIKIKFLCVGGGGVNVGAQQCSIIIFMCVENAMDRKRYQIYRDKILIPFIAQTRTEYGE